MTDISVQIVSNVSLGCVNVGRTPLGKLYLAVDDYRTCNYAVVHMNVAEAKALMEGLSELIQQMDGSGDASSEI